MRNGFWSLKGFGVVVLQCRWAPEVAWDLIEDEVEEAVKGVVCLKWAKMMVFYKRDIGPKGTLPR